MYLAGLQACTSNRIATTTASQCAAAGGVFDAFSRYDLQYPKGFCSIPGICSGGSPANINVSVPTTTQVSPQISPNLIQQQQPQNSPINASAAQVPTTGTSQSDLDSQYQAALNASKQRQQDLIDALNAQAATAAANTQSMVPAVTYSTVDSGSNPLLPPAASTSNAAPTNTIDPMLYIAGAGLLIGVIGLIKRK